MLLQLFYSSLQTKCIKIHQGAIPNYDPSSLAVVTVDTVAALFSASILGYLLLLARHRRDPVVQKSGTHFLPFLFGGALLCQLSGILFLNARLGPGTCSLLQLLSGLSPTIMFAAILVKTRKVYVIFEKQMKDMANR